MRLDTRLLVAMALAGPQDPQNFFERDALLELRRHKWQHMLSEQDRGVFLTQATAAIKELDHLWESRSS